MHCTALAKVVITPGGRSNENEYKPSFLLTDFMANNHVVHVPKLTLLQDPVHQGQYQLGMLCQSSEFLNRRTVYLLNADEIGGIVHDL